MQPQEQDALHLESSRPPYDVPSSIFSNASAIRRTVSNFTGMSTTGPQISCISLKAGPKLAVCGAGETAADDQEIRLDFYDFFMRKMISY
jgi:hypothetical protein